MQLNLAGIIDMSTIDWYGHGATVIFFRGCPLHCPNCINDKYRTGESMVDMSEISSRLVRATPFVGHVVLSGGEPLAQPEACTEIIRRAHSLGLQIGVETSGCLPLVDGFDFIMVSVKTSLRRGPYSRQGWSDTQYDTLLANLNKLHPKRSEIRVVLFRDSDYDFSTFKPIRGIPIRIQLGVEPKPLSTTALNMFAVNMAKSLKYNIVSYTDKMYSLKPKR